MSSGLKVGENVHFMRVTSTGRRIQCSTRDATVVAICPAVGGGEVLKVRLSNGRTELIHESEVRRDGEKTHVHSVLEALTKNDDV